MDIQLDAHGGNGEGDGGGNWIDSNDATGDQYNYIWTGDVSPKHGNGYGMGYGDSDGNGYCCMQNGERVNTLIVERMRWL